MTFAGMTKTGGLIRQGTHDENKLYGGALNPYISNQDISKWPFSPHGAV